MVFLLFHSGIQSLMAVGDFSPRDIRLYFVSG